MKLTIAAAFLGLCALALSTPVQQGKVFVPDQDFIVKQKQILTLFKYVNQPSYYKEHVDIANSFNVEGHVDFYTKPEVVKQFLYFYKYGFLQKGEIFSIFYDEHLKQAKALFELFYYAKDFETFYKTAVWARQYLNEGLFLYTFSVAVVHRSDTYGIVLPPIYEVYPYYFFNSETIHKAYQYKQTYYQKDAPKNEFVVYSNYSGYYLNLHPEQYMSYFTEDVGINSFYYYYNIYYPFWLDGEVYGLKYDNRGELYYFVHQQLLARYYLERLSNGFGEIEQFNWELPFTTSYYPSLRYPNGLEFPSRPKFAKLYEYFYNYGQKYTDIYSYSYSFVNEYEHRIFEAIDRGFVYTKSGEKVDLYSERGFNTFANLVESNADSPNNKYYGPIQFFARHLLGYSFQPFDYHKLAPSALEHFETSLRDPAFYQFYKKIMGYFFWYKQYLPTYAEKELYFDGVKVEKVEFDRLITYFDYFFSDIDNAVFVTPEEFEKDSFHIRARQYRLNHKPFTYKINVKSDKDTKVAVKVFLGPKYDEYERYINFTENYVNFVQFDHFVYDLKSGENVIKRNSYENFFYGPDRTSYHDLYKQVLSGEYKYNWQESYFTFPLRYLLPKGNYNGFPYQFYVFVYPYKAYKGGVATDYRFPPKVGTGGLYVDGYPLGYPFDRPVKNEQFFYNIPNGYFYDTKIYHKNVEDINASSS